MNLPMLRVRSRAVLAACALGALALLAPARADAPLPGFGVEAELQPVYRPGEAGVVIIRLRYDAASAALADGVIFLNVVERDAARKWPQAAHRIFAAASEDPPVFRRVYDGAALQSGLNTTLRFRLRERAPLGDYALVVQLYRGDETNPNAVRPEDRVLMRGFDFAIVGE